MVIPEINNPTFNKAMTTMVPTQNAAPHKSLFAKVINTSKA